MFDTVQFFRAWLSAPLRVASVVPSGRALSKAITSEINADHAPVIELGPGTGAFTRQLLERGVPGDRVALVEYGSEFAELLKTRFPSSKVMCGDAAHLKAIEFFPGEKAGAVISGLPLLSMPNSKVLEILHGSFHHLREGGAFYQFTYGRRCPIAAGVLDRLGLKAVRISGVFANFPPAQVYRITRNFADIHREARPLQSLVQRYA